jgi:hypothetical protein
VLRAPGRLGQNKALLGASVGALVLFVVLLLVFTTRGGAHTDTEVEGGAIVVTPTATTAEPPPPEKQSDDDKIAAALSDIDKGDYGSGIAVLDALDADHLNRPDIHRALYRAYMATKNPKGAMKEAGLLFKADPSAIDDTKYLEDIRNTALRTEASDDAFALLATGTGTQGIDVLYDIAHEQWASQYPVASARAQKLLGKADIRARASVPLSVAIDLRLATTCDAKKALLPRAKESGDFRTAILLRSYLSTRSCSSFFATRDCYPCLRKDATLKQTLQAIEDRIASAPKK